MFRANGQMQVAAALSNIPTLDRINDASDVIEGVTRNCSRCELISSLHDFNGWQLAKMKKSIPDMSLP